MARRGEKLLVAAAALLLATSGARAQTPDRVNTIRDVIVRLGSCWRPPPPSRARALDITVVVSFNRTGDILGHPKITYESAEASDNDRLQYRIAVMEALQRCTPMPFTDAMGGAAAGRPFAVQFHGRKTSPPTQERPA
ncbi:hypothetical protein [Bradyrhizobium neotropicale]|uniref:TonB C-terminal domain-containing protein n=1 Tax=Bradyrhizobium neotropicale TaxID=1497615 RepID=A0A176YY69_9BRAD|nr:hypothetical protein [Bradyrhizobium neotropicale]OAF12135.1 hypothetical protein AXW67_21395 [Bradyrhizobium neotropicale]